MHTPVFWFGLEVGFGIGFAVGCVLVCLSEVSMSKKSVSTANFKPNYEVACIVCGAKPTIDIHPTRPNSEVTQTEMCGPCTWGDPDTIDPANW